MNCLKPYSIWKDSPSGDDSVMHTVPCGKCLPCLVKSRRDWIFRLEQEHKASKGALFVTLTYSPKYCPNSVVKKHLQLFMKRLRKHDKTNRLRYFAVGEYGTKRQRPHYHLLLFNLEDSNHLRKSWTYGQIHVGKVTASSIAYCTKYIVQPEQDNGGRLPPFRLMSRGYGLGLAYLSDAMVQWHRDGDRNYTFVNRTKSSLPKYYKSKIWYRENDKKRLSDKAKIQSAKAAENELKYYQKVYGKEAHQKKREFENAMLNRIKVKVSYTEKL